MQWISGKAAANMTGISMAHLRHLVREGALEGQERVRASGQRFLMIRKDQLYNLHEQLANAITLNKAMEILGLGKIRLQRTLKLLFPSAKRIQDKIFMPWSIPLGDVMALVEIGSELPCLITLEENQVSFAHVLKYWNWSTDEIVSLVEAVKSEEILPIAQLVSATGVGRWVFHQKKLRAWLQQLDTDRAYWVTIPETAKLLGIKQEVAYWLTQNNYILAEKLGTLRDIRSRVKKAEIERFQHKYIFATKISDRVGWPPRHVKHVLAVKLGIHPLQADSNAKPCRQLIYLRSNALDRFIRKYERVARKRNTTEDLAKKSVE